ncbi:unnamed protein product [Allacma fusca]|uniref:lysozyme n=1 Tax=Allacma fusca TaxID=39272 RepID=A0A8J2LNA0_9HEXA|nr:unnamed protein product [Allacma fusca]
MRGFTFALAIVLAIASTEATRFTKCDLARRLKLHGAPNYDEWTCIADVNTDGYFDTEWKNGDGFGLWEISAREWCKDPSFPAGANRCGFDCERFRDGFLTDDLRCLREIHADRSFYGFNGWFRRFRKCPNLSTYLAECGL